MLIEQREAVERWILDHVRDLYIDGTTYKRAAELATIALEFKISPTRISRVRERITLFIPSPFDGWYGRCKGSQWSKVTELNAEEWEALEIWCRRLAEAICELGDVTLIALMARRAGVARVNPRTMEHALKYTARDTGWKPPVDTAVSAARKG